QELVAGDPPPQPASRTPQIAATPANAQTTAGGRMCVRLPDPCSVSTWPGAYPRRSECHADHQIADQSIGWRVKIGGSFPASSQPPAYASTGRPTTIAA